MPSLIKCAKCGTPLWRNKGLPAKEFRQSVTDLYNRLDGQCNACGHKLPDPSRFSEFTEYRVKPTEFACERCGTLTPNPHNRCRCGSKRKIPVIAGEAKV